MKFGINTLIWSVEYDSTVEAMLPLIKQNGFDGVEIPVFSPSTFDPAPFRRAVESHSLEVNACTVIPQGSSLGDSDANSRQAARRHVEEVIKAVADADGKILAGPIFTPVGYLPGRRRTSDEWRYAAEELHSLGDTAQRNGIRLAIEPLNRFETYFLNTAADGAALCDLVNHPAVGILFDTFHANIEEKDIAAGYRTLGRHLFHVHTCENDRGIPGSGHVEWPAVFQALRDLNYDGWLTIESFGFAIKEIAAAACIWRDIELTPEAIAFEGIKFLRANWPG